MSDLNKKYKEILKEIEKNIKDENDLKMVNEKITELSVLFIEMLNDVTENFENRIQELEEQQVFVQGKLKKIQGLVDDLESDIYEDNFNFEILCPYCNNEFTAEVESEAQKDIKCPECNNVIELDWNEDCEEDACGCSGCCDECEDECDFGENCDCEDECDCGENCDCEDECDCSEECNCEDCDCEDECDDDCDCGCKEHHKHDEE